MAIRSTNPHTGKIEQEFRPISDADLDGKLRRADEAFRSWRAVSFSDRATMMNALAELVEAEAPELGAIATREMGKPIKQAVAEATKCATACRYYAEHAESLLAEEVAEAPTSYASVRYDPVGAILAVMPWNFPYWQVFRFLAPTLMAGNVGLLKHASNVPQVALKVEELVTRAGFPEGVFQTLLIESSRVEGVIASPAVKGVSLTGSTAAGSRVAAAAGREIKHVVLELGGSDPLIVMPSCDFDRTVEVAVTARLQNTGQSCIAAKRTFVHRAIYDRFRDAYVTRMASLKVGDPMDPDTDVGPMASAAMRDELAAQVDASVAAGATVLLGGRALDGPGYYYAPTILADVPAACPAAQEELFGPVSSLFPVDSMSEAVSLANASEYGLGASVWTNDESERQEAIADLESGMVFVNDMVKSDPHVPFGGVKKSGIGRELGVYGLREFVNIKTVWIS